MEGELVVLLEGELVVLFGKNLKYPM